MTKTSGGGMTHNVVVCVAVIGVPAVESVTIAVKLYLLAWFDMPETTPLCDRAIPDGKPP